MVVVRFYSRVGFPCHSRAVAGGGDFLNQSGSNGKAWSVLDKGRCERAWKGGFCKLFGLARICCGIKGGNWVIVVIGD